VHHATIPIYFGIDDVLIDFVASGYDTFLELTDFLGAVLRIFSVKLLFVVLHAVQERNKKQFAHNNLSYLCDMVITEFVSVCEHSVSCE